MTSCTFSTSIYTYRRPNGPVLENTFSEASATPDDMWGFVMPKILAMRPFAHPSMVSGGMGLSVRTPAWLRTCFQHPVHPMRLKTQKVGFCDPEGNQTMPAFTQRTVAPTPSTQDAIPASNLHAVLAAFNASNMASSYIERGNFAAARRKLTQALSAINTLQAEA